MRFSRTNLALWALLAPVLLAGCRTARATGPAVNGAATPGTAVMRVYDTKASRWVRFEEMVVAAAKADMVFLGEQHDDPVTHSLELAVLAALGERRPRVVLSLEMFERDVQPLLDAYLAGTMPEQKFLADSRPWDRYATDYRPLVELAHVRGWPVVASNVPRRIASGVSRRGLAYLDSLNPSERAFAAAQHSCPKDRYFELFTATMSGHGGGAAPAAGAGSSATSASTSAADAAVARSIIERYYQAQCVKDEAMGDAVATAFLRDGKRSIVLHVDGAFHSDFGLGTVERARRRVPDAKTVVLTAVPVAELSAADVAPHRSKGDYIVFTLAPRKSP
jgi:uncharacterized iron-regulated protein